MNTEDMEGIKRYFGVVAEGLRHDLQQVAEGHQVILTQAQQFREEVQEEFKEVKALIKEPLIYCDSGMQGKASRSETRGLS